MTTETAEKTFKKVSGNFPPFLVLVVGEKCQGVIESADVKKTIEREKVKGKYVEKEKERLYFTMKLTEVCEAHTGKLDENKKYQSATFEKGQTITLPQSGQLDTTFRRISLELAGEDPMDPKAEADFQSLIGIEMKIKRLADGVMKKGANKGNPVKNYEVEYAA